MSVSINYRAEEIILDDGYAVRVRINDTTEIPSELFVFKIGGMYSHVATLRDIALYPVGEAAARSLGHVFFRAAEMLYTANTPAAVRNARDQIIVRLRVAVAAHKASTLPDFGAVVEESIT